MESVNKRDFVRQFSKYLRQGGEFCLTNKGKPECYVRISAAELSDKPKIVRQKEESKHLKEAEEFVEKVSEFVPVFKSRLVHEYGCGCKKEEDKFLCPKHQRV